MRGLDCLTSFDGATERNAGPLFFFWHMFMSPTIPRRMFSIPCIHSYQLGAIFKLSLDGVVLKPSTPGVSSGEPASQQSAVSETLGMPHYSVVSVGRLVTESYARIPWHAALLGSKRSRKGQPQRIRERN